MANWKRKEGTYYDRECEQRRQYQRDYYARNRETMKRQRELERELDPETHRRKCKAMSDYRKFGGRGRPVADSGEG